ncbi:hypothetical protein [Streptomyces sp. NPDC003015]
MRRSLGRVRPQMSAVQTRLAQVLSSTCTPPAPISMPKPAGEVM